VATERVVLVPFWKQGEELLPDRLDEVWWDSGHGHPPSNREA
jgi:hypothetical protein